MTQHCLHIWLISAFQGVVADVDGRKLVAEEWGQAVVAGNATVVGALGLQMCFWHTSIVKN
jgi:heat shock protein HspQ